uniref:Platelet-derived growth factor (PDGF) family profile domain-containing protein n=1 Tax=Ornithorhynchus anatinus TaxID=9258 RepID=F6S0B4_ORNAN
MKPPKMMLLPPQLLDSLPAEQPQPGEGKRRKWVFSGASCQPGQVPVSLTVEFPQEVTHLMVPGRVTLRRCGGRCPDEASECLPTGQRPVRMRILMIKDQSKRLKEFTLEEHIHCECRYPEGHGGKETRPCACPYVCVCVRPCVRACVLAGHRDEDCWAGWHVLGRGGLGPRLEIRIPRFS